jgi:DNA-binding NarL/FixJ family response regulator
MARPPDSERVPWLTPRQREVVRLVGGRGWSYKRVASELRHHHAAGRTLSTRTIEEYSRQIRDAIGSPLRPRDALHELYRSSPEAFD